MVPGLRIFDTVVTVMTKFYRLHACLIACALSVGLGAAAPAFADAPAAATVAQLEAVPAPDIAARSWLLLDMTSGQVLAQHNPDQIAAPASLTKLMTAYLTFKALQQGRLRRDQLVHESSEAWRTGGSRMFIDPKVPVSVDNLLFGMIVQSGNDAAMTLSEAVGGTTSAFVAMMNRQAAQWDLKDTHFMDPTGLPDPGHHSSAHDLSIIAAHIIDDFPMDYARYFKVKEFTYNRITQPNRVSLLFTDPSVDGMKTGYTRDAGYCMITSAQRAQPNGARRLLAVVMGTDSERARVAQSAKLLNWGFQNFDDVRLADAGRPVVTVKVWKGASNAVGLGAFRTIAVSVPRGEGAHLHTDVQRPDPLVAPLRKGQVIGTLRVSLEGKPLASHPLVALQNVQGAGFFKRAWDSFRLMIK